MVHPSLDGPLNICIQGWDSSHRHFLVSYVLGFVFGQTMRCPKRTYAHMEGAFKQYHTQTNPHTSREGLQG